MELQEHLNENPRLSEWYLSFSTEAVIMAVASALVLDQSVDRGSLALGALSGAAGGAGHATVNQESVIKNCMNGRGYSVLR